MAEEKPDSENPGSDLGKNASLDTTPVADVTQNRIEDEAPIPQEPNFPLLVLSWGVCYHWSLLFIRCWDGLLQRQRH